MKRGIFYTFLTQAPTLLMYFVASTAMTRLLGDEGRGEYALITNLTALLSMVMGLNIGFGITYFTARSNTDHKAAIGTSLTLLLANLALIPLILWGISSSDVLMRIFMPEGRTQWYFWAFILLAVILSMLNSAISGVLLGLKNFAAINVMSLFTAGSSAVGFILLHLFRDRVPEHDRFTAVLAVTGASMTLVSLAWCWYYKRHVGLVPRPLTDWKLMRPVIAFTLVGHMSNLINLINYRFDIWVVDVYHGPAQLGLYAVAVGLGQLLFQIPEPFSRVAQPFLFGQVKDEMIARFKSVARISFSAVLVAAVGMALTAHWVIPLLFGEVFQGSVVALYFLLPGILFSSAFKVLAQLSVHGGLQHYNLLGTAVGAITTILLDLLLIPQMGIIGAALASSIAYLVILLVMMRVIHVKMGVTVFDTFLVHAGDVREVRRMMNRRTEQ